MSLFRLPVSGLGVSLRELTGYEEVLLAGSSSDPRATALALLRQLGDGTDFESLVVHDFEALLLRFRESVFGDSVVAEAPCGCGEIVDISFWLSDLEADRRPRWPRGLPSADAQGWFALDGRPAFRLPTVADQLAVAREANPTAAMATRCLRPDAPRGRALRAMETLAPGLSGPVAGTCPHCGREVEQVFDLPTYVVAELRARSQLLYEDAHLIASSYHWSEDSILSLPTSRRQRYAASILAESEAF